MINTAGFRQFYFTLIGSTQFGLPEAYRQWKRAGQTNERMSNRDNQATFTSTHKEDCFYLHISNSLEEKDTQQLEWMFRKAIASSCKYVLVDCRRMKNISIPALRAFLANMGPVQAKGMKMGIFGLSAELMDSLSNSGMDTLLTIAETEEKVMELLKSKQRRVNN